MFHFDLNFTEKFGILIKITLKSVLVQVMAWYQRGDKPLPEPMLTKMSDAI